MNAAYPEVLLDTPQGSIPLKYSVVTLPDSADGQVDHTIELMNKYVCEDARTQAIQQVAQQALALDPDNPLAAVHQYVRGTMVFKQDEDTARPYEWMLPKDGQEHYFVEALKRPVDVAFEYAATGKQVAGDCDDFSMMCAAILCALGVPCCFATVAASSKDPSVYSHVYVVAYWRGQRCAMDCSHGQVAGFEAPNAYGKFREWPVEDTASWAVIGSLCIAALWFCWRNRQEIRGWLS